MRIATSARRWGLVTIVLLSSLLAASSCDDNPTGPGTNGGYYFYFNAGAPQATHLRYQSCTGAIDSLTFPTYSDRAMALSPDGSLLYLGHTGGVTVITADSQQVVENLPYIPSGRGIAFSPDGTQMAIAGRAGLYILTYPGYTELYHFPDTVYNAEFSKDGRALYCIRGQAPWGVCRIAIDDSTYIADTVEIPIAGVPERIVPDPNLDVWYVLVRMPGPDLYSFARYNRVTDSLEFVAQHQPGAGDIAVTPDGKYVFFSNPGTLFSGPVSTTRFSVYSPEENRIIKVIVSEDYVGDSTRAIVLGRLAISPDGKHLAAIEGPLGIGFVIIDVSRLTPEYHQNAPGTYFGEVVCQNRR